MVRSSRSLQEPPTDAATFFRLANEGNAEAVEVRPSRALLRAPKLGKNPWLHQSAKPDNKIFALHPQKAVALLRQGRSYDQLTYQVTAGPATHVLAFSRAGGYTC